MARQGKETGSKARITKRAIDDLRVRAKSEGRTLYLRDEEVTGFGALCTKAGCVLLFRGIPAWRARHDTEADDHRKAWRAYARPSEAEGEGRAGQDGPSG